MITRFMGNGVVLMLLLAAGEGWGVEANPFDFAEAGRWATAGFEGRGAAPEAEAGEGLIVFSNYGVVQQNARSGEPLNIGGESFTNGLYCHAPSKILVRLGAPGKEFRAVAGIDSRANGGSVAFRVLLEDKERFSSGVLRFGDAGVPVAVALDGAREFVLEVKDGGDGISSDQSDWANAEVVLEDGRLLRLGDLPMLDTTAPAYAVTPFFSFQYGGRSSEAFLKDWLCKRESRPRDAAHVEQIITYTDPESGLEVRCVGVVGKAYPSVEWTVYFKNTGAADTPPLAEIQALDTRLERAEGPEFLLRHHRGDSCTIDSFEPLQTVLTAKQEVSFAPDGGRPSSGQWPYYNLEWGGGGVLLAIGWPGQWASHFTRDEGLGLRVQAGQEKTHFVLHPGEEVRTPLIALLFYRGDWLRGQNLWRSWMFGENFPKPKSGALGPVLAGCSGWHFPNLMCNQAGEITFIDRYLEEDININFWWMDAGWYPCDGVGWPKVGTWEPDPVRYPGGLRAVCDHAHAKGVETVVWFEPERVHPGTWITENHPDWVFGGENGGLFKMGEAAPREWITNHVDRLITEQGIDLYRQDFNIDPLAFWRGNDAEDRQGITEIRHVEGYLAYWDELRRRHPGMLIDSCASGGRRDDLESMRRAVPLLRTDFEFDTTGNQCCTYGFNLWLPYYECGNRDIAEYAFRSNMAPWLSFVWDVRKRDLNYDLARHFIGQWREVADYYFGDFYPLTSYSIANDAWLAWQFDRPDLGAGMVQVFRRANCPYTAGRFPLRGLELGSEYTVRNIDEKTTSVFSGKELRDDGLPLEVLERPGGVIYVYTRKTP